MAGPPPAAAGASPVRGARPASNSVSSTAHSLSHHTVPPSVPKPCKLTVRKDRSLSTAALQSFIKPFGAHLVTPGSVQPAGSPELTPHASLYRRCNVRMRIVEGIRIYDINVRSNTTSAHFNHYNSDPNAYEDRMRRAAAEVEYNEPVNLDPGESHAGNAVVNQDFVYTGRDSKRRRQIYYFAGGGFQSPATKDHWKFCAHLAVEMSKDGRPTTVSLVSYPLAPNSPAHKAFPMLVSMYTALFVPPEFIADRAMRDILPRDVNEKEPVEEMHSGTSSPSNRESPSRGSPARSSPSRGSPSRPGLSRLVTGQSLGGASLKQTLSDRMSRLTVARTAYHENEEVIFAGDSAGGNIVLGLVLHMLQEFPDAPVPAQLLVISPAVDLRNENPDIHKVAPRDPVLRPHLIDQTARAWLGLSKFHKGGTNTSGTGLPLEQHQDPPFAASDPRVSPILADLSPLAARGVCVHGIIAGHDILGPDAQLFFNALQQAGVAGHWLRWERTMHCFPLAFAYGLSEAKSAVKWVMNVLSGAPV